MEKYFITTDKTADYPISLEEQERNFAVMDMTYAVDGTLYDGTTNTLSTKQFYALLAQGKTSSTSMVPIATAQAFFENILSKGFDILHISFSSALSGCYDGYLQASQKALANYPDRKIVVIDSLCAACGEGLLVYYVLRKRDEGASFEECVQYANNIKNHIGHLFTVDDMMHLYRGGRVTKTTAVVGQALKMKPVLCVSTEGKLVPTNTVMGRKLALKMMVDKMAVKNVGYDDKAIFIGHCDALNDALTLKSMVEEKLDKHNIIVSEISPIVGSHLGKGGLTLHFLTVDKEPSLK